LHAGVRALRVQVPSENERFIAEAEEYEEEFEHAATIAMQRASRVRAALAANRGVVRERMREACNSAARSTRCMSSRDAEYNER